MAVVAIIHTATSCNIISNKEKQIKITIDLVILV